MSVRSHRLGQCPRGPKCDPWLVCYITFAKNLMPCAAPCVRALKDRGLCFFHLSAEGVHDLAAWADVDTGPIDRGSIETLYSDLLLTLL